LDGRPSLRAKRTAITATEVFEMQNNQPRIPKIAGKLVLRGSQASMAAWATQGMGSAA